LVVFDSDCIVPPHYFEAVNQALMNEAFDAWGGPDRGHETFTPLQQAMAFTMAAGLTTGGIRGGKRENFQPRSFNMGMSKAVFEKTGGFRFSRLAEDIELSVRMRKAGFKVVLLKQAYVYHKRRTTLTQFFKQVVGFGRGRVRVGKAHPGEVKPVHWLPSLFLAGIILLPLLLLVYPPLFWLGSSLLMVFLITVAVQAYRVTRLAKVALLVIPATLVQLMGYGYGFISEQLKPVSEATSR
jgi:GT2 family glycosyltransferase